MRILYTNPIFADYRLAFYQELHRLSDGGFHVMYSPLRYTLEGSERIVKKIQSQIPDIAFAYTDEKLKLVRNPLSKDFDPYYRFPVTHNFYKNISRFNPEVLITEGFFQWTPMVVWYAWRHHLPVYIGYERTKHTERNAPFYKIWERKLLDKFVTGYFANGTETREYLLSLGIKAEKIHIAGMNADSEGLRKGIASVSSEEKQRIKDSLTLGTGITYLYSGQFIPRKGISYMLDAWREHTKKYPEDSIILIGGGELLEEFKQKYANLTTAHILGKVSYDEVYRYYAISDVFVIPTLEDNWCLVVPEAMSCGMPVACSKYNGGAVDLIREGENGTIFDPLDAPSMQSALEFFHGKDLKAMGQRSIELEKPWNTENAARRLYDVIVKDYNDRRR